MGFVAERLENMVGTGENPGYQHLLLFQYCLQKLSLSGWLHSGPCGNKLPFPNSSKLKDYNFKSDENGRKFSKWVENTVGKRRNCSLRAISPFPTVFSKDLNCRNVKTRACLRKG